MNLHYRKLMITSIAFPIVVVVILVIATPSLMQSRESAMFASMRGQIRQMEMLLVQIEMINAQQELTEPIKLAQDVAETQQDSLLGLVEATASRSQGNIGAGWVTALSGLVGMLGTITSILFSWRQDMRDAKAEVARMQAATDCIREYRGAA